MKVLIYRDYGCAAVDSLYEEVNSYFASSDLEVGFTDAAEIKAGVLNKDVKAFFLGGGAGNPFMQKLEGIGNDRIRAYVENGGIYFGICAGAYYACRDVVFEKDIPELCIENQCGLNLIEGRAVGTLYKELDLLPYSLTAFSVRVVHIRFNDGETYPALYHGGPWFDRVNGTVLAVYEEAGQKPAVIEKRFGWGKVILSGVHFEDGERILKKGLHSLRCDKEAAERNFEEMRLQEGRRKELSERLLRLI